MSNLKLEKFEVYIFYYEIEKFLSNFKKFEVKSTKIIFLSMLIFYDYFKKQKVFKFPGKKKKIMSNLTKLFF